MRQIHVQVKRRDEETVLRLGEEHEAFSPMATSVRRADGSEWSMIFMNLPNDRVGAFVDAVAGRVEDTEFVLIPRGTIPFRKPISAFHEKVRSVSHRSSLELVLGSLQSVGSWKGMLLYAVFSGIVAAYGVIFVTSYLLTAAMLIAPLGAPAMVSVVGVTIGDWKMFQRGLVRFWVAIAVLAAAAWTLGMAYPLDISTATMEQISSLSIWSVLLAVVGGAAGAQSQVQSDRDSLVTATATGFLVAVALSPPSAVLGLAAAVGRWDYAAQMAFIVVLTYFGILVGGWISLTIYEVRPGQETMRRGSGQVRTALVAAAVLIGVAMVVWQSRQSPRFVKGDLSRDAVSLARRAVGEVPGTRLLEADAHFTRRDLRGSGDREALLLSVVVEQTLGGIPRDSVESMVRTAVQNRILSSTPQVIPYVQVSVLPGPAMQ